MNFQANHTYRPRNRRSKIMGSIAYARAKAKGATVLAATVAKIHAEFGDAGEINSFKQRVERLMLFGPTHAAVRARYGGRAAVIRGLPLGLVCDLVSTWYKRERKVLQIATALGTGVAHPVNVLRELRLILRWMRFKKLECHFNSYVDDVLGR